MTKWTIKRNETTENIFDAAMKLGIAKNKLKKISKEMNLIQNECNYKNSILWRDVEKYLEINNKYLELTSSDFDQIEVREISKENSSIKDFFKKIF